MKIEDLVASRQLFSVRTPGAAAYLIIHKKSNKVYVGSTATVSRRIRHHLASLKRGDHDNKNLQERYNDDPEVDFVYYTVKDIQEALALEKALIEHYHEQNRVLNMELDPVTHKRDMSRKQHISWRKAALKSTDEKSIPLTIEGKDFKSLNEAARAYGISHSTVICRLKSKKLIWKNWHFKNKPKDNNDHSYSTRANLIWFNGKKYNLADYSRLVGVKRTTIRGRQLKGIPDERLHLSSKDNT